MEQKEKMKKIRVRGLKKTFIERRNRLRFPGQCHHRETCLVLDNLNFSVEQGSFTCFVGPSGCGKSTLLRIIAGFETQTSGTVLIDGRSVDAPSEKHVFVFQEDGLFPWLTAWQNVSIGARHIRDPQQRRHEIEEHMDLVGLSGFEDHYPHELSGGMKRRAEVARALIVEPDILFMDEPFGALDFVTRLQMREEMVNVHTMYDMTILFITHDIDEALQLGDQVIVLSDRPSRINADIRLDFPHPRDLTTGKIAEIRKEIYYQMGLHPAL